MVAKGDKVISQYIRAYINEVRGKLSIKDFPVDESIEFLVLAFLYRQLELERSNSNNENNFIDVVEDYLTEKISRNYLINNNKVCDFINFNTSLANEILDIHKEIDVNRLVDKNKLKGFSIGFNLESEDVDGIEIVEHFILRLSSNEFYSNTNNASSDEENYEAMGFIEHYDNLKYIKYDLIYSCYVITLNISEEITSFIKNILSNKEIDYRHFIDLAARGELTNTKLGDDTSNEYEYSNLKNVLQHELIHYKQRRNYFIRFVKSRGKDHILFGLPKKDRLNKKDFGHSHEIPHGKRPIEFWTRLNDQIEIFKNIYDLENIKANVLFTNSVDNRVVSKIEDLDLIKDNLLKTLNRYVSASEWFRYLKKEKPSYWKKAVSEFFIKINNEFKSSINFYLSEVDGLYYLARRDGNIEIDEEYRYVNSSNTFEKIT